MMKKTRHREIKSLEKAMQECHLKTAKIITLDEKEIIETPSGKIEACPAWEWAVLQQEE